MVLGLPDLAPSQEISLRVTVNRPRTTKARKICGICGRCLELACFSLRADWRDVFRHVCRNCLAASARERRRAERAAREAAEEREWRAFERALERRRKRRPVSDEEHVELTRRISGDAVADAMLELRRRTGTWPGQHGRDGVLTLSVSDETIELEKVGGTWRRRLTRRVLTTVR